MIADLLPCAILVPSLNRSQNLERLTENIHDATPENHFILFCVSDIESMEVLDRLCEWYLDDSDVDDHRYVTRMNKLIGEGYLDDAKTIFFGSDDVIHHPGWLHEALVVMDSGPSVVVCNDLHNSAGTQAVVRREYLSRAVFDHPGLAFCPDYHHNFADNEMFLTASLRGELGYAPKAIVEHLHPVWRANNSLPWDTTYINAQKGWTQDAELWAKRAKMLEQTLSPSSPPMRLYR